MLQLGLGLGLGLGLQQQQQQQQQQSQPVVVEDPIAESVNFDETMESMDMELASSSPTASASAAAAAALVPDTEQVSLADKVLPTLTPDVIDVDMHAPAGKETAFHKPTAEDSIAPLQKSKPNLPENFLSSVYETRTGNQYVDYLPNEPNMNEAKYCE